MSPSASVTVNTIGGITALTPAIWLGMVEILGPPVTKKEKT